MTCYDYGRNPCRCSQSGAIPEGQEPHVPLLPDQPPPQPGHGDVLLDLADHNYVKALRYNERDPLPLRRLLHDAIFLAHQLCIHLGVDLREAILERRRIGIERYSQPLRYDDGRNLTDAAQKAVDLAGYLLREIGK